MRERAEAFNVLVAGIGGQGVLLVSKTIAAAALQESRFASRTESRGLSQRGGSVSSVIRIGSRPVSPFLALGSAHLILALDALEALRSLPYLHGDGLLLSQETAIPPSHLAEDNPGEILRFYQEVEAGFCLAGARARRLNLKQAALAARCPKGLNAVLLGAASAYLPLAAATLRMALFEQVKPQYREGNMAAFERGVRALDAPAGDGPHERVTEPAHAVSGVAG